MLTPAQRLAGAGCLLMALLVTAGCAGRALGGPHEFHVYPPPAPKTVGTPPSPLPKVVLPPPVPEALAKPVLENETFVTVRGVPQYKIGPGDIVEILIIKGSTQERYTAAVRSDGSVSLPVGTIRVGGRSAEQAAEDLERYLKQFYREPRVEVLVKEYRSKKITIIGAVSHTAGGSVLDVTGRIHLADALARAGGFRATSAIDAIQIRRATPKQTTYVVNLFQLFSEEAPLEVVLEAGDVVYVPERTLAAQRFYIFGEVKTPGDYNWAPGMHLSRALAIAGGPTDNAVFQSARIIRGPLERPELLEVDFERILRTGDVKADPLVMPDDIVYVPRSAIGNWNAFLAKLRPTLEFLTLPLSPGRIGQTQK